jgi:type IV secretory pathway VirD2 relaxase
MHYARTSRKATSRAAAGGKMRSTPAYHQRCAVRVTYLNNRTRGQWKAHGRYLARESATFESGMEGAGFSRDGDGIDLAQRLQTWQADRDERLWKLIVSPEFGDRVELARLTRDLMRRMEEELATELEWAAVEHHNTEHPHVHRGSSRTQGQR